MVLQITCQQAFSVLRIPPFALQGNPVEYTIMEFAEMISATVGK